MNRSQGEVQVDLAAMVISETAVSAAERSSRVSWKHAYGTSSGSPKWGYGILK